MTPTHSHSPKQSSSLSISSTALLTTIVFATLLTFCGCGKNEAAGSLVGGASGAAIGAAVCNSHNRGTGALIGGLAGTLLGSTVGRGVDDDEREEDHAREREYHARVQAQQEARHRHEVARVQAENSALKQTLNRWCINCNRQVNLVGANSCPGCGGQLIHERFCRGCAQTFSPTSGYRYCPYCREGVVLSAR